MSVRSVLEPVIFRTTHRSTADAQTDCAMSSVVEEQEDTSLKEVFKQQFI